MKMMGVEFAPINIPLRRRLQTLAAAAWIIILVFGGLMGLFLAIYLVLCTKLWWLTLIYLGWAWVLDKDTCETGGKWSTWMRNWAWWTYFRAYFPLSLERAPWVRLDPKRNYLFCSVPHGMLSSGAFSAFCTDIGGFHALFPHHRPHLATLGQHFHMPFFRELAYGLGAVSASAKSIRALLGYPGGGQVAVLVVGGASESYLCRPGQYKTIIKKRKGFARLALEYGTPLVPVISFGETDLFSQVDNPEGSMLRRVQESVRKMIGFAPVIPLGRGFFQYSFGILPQRRPVATVVGPPLDVQKVESPSREQVEELHAKFCAHLQTFFEEQKHNYLENADKTELVME